MQLLLPGLAGVSVPACFLIWQSAVNLTESKFFCQARVGRAPAGYPYRKPGRRASTPVLELALRRGKVYVSRLAP